MNESRRVYSTDAGRLCAQCKRAIGECVCKDYARNKLRNNDSDGVIRISRETKGRKGKGVTLLSGFQMTDKELKDYAKKLKQLCGTGGTIKNEIVEIQGDHRDKLQGFLIEKGYKVKRVGG